VKIEVPNSNLVGGEWLSNGDTWYTMGWVEAKMLVLT
jgi:hypothetical protein